MKGKKALHFASLFILLLFFQQLSRAGVNQPPSNSSHNPHVADHKEATKTTPRKQRNTPSETLPNNLPRKAFLKHIADGLDWVPSAHRRYVCRGYFKEPAIVKRYPHPAPVKQEPAIITAKGPSTIETHGVSILEKDVVVTQPGRRVMADKAYIYRDGKTGRITKVILVGHVRLLEAGKLIIADRGTLTIYPKTALLINTAYHLYSKKAYNHTLKGAYNAWGTAKRAFRDKNEITHLRHATYTTCSPTNPVWQVSGTTIILNHPEHQGQAYNAVLRIKNIPVFYTPYYSFPLDHVRKTGFLAPRLGYSSRSGGVFAWPFYWNMAPNYDLTLTPQYFTERNFDFSGFFRFMSERSVGTIYADYLPNDMAFEKFRNNTFNTFVNPPYNQTFFAPYLNQLQTFTNTRAFFSMTDISRLNSEWTSHIDLNYVTDPYYFQDLSGALNSNSASNQLLNQIDLHYEGWHWEFTSMLQAFQTLHVITQTQNPALDQYSRLPDLNLNGYYPDVVHDLDIYLNGEFVNFSYQSLFLPNKPMGQRLHLRPGLSIPITYASAYFTPQAWADLTGYNVEHVQPGQVSSADRILPIFDIDSGLYFDQDFHLGTHNFTQTLEPRFFYLYVPYRNQDSLPNFDTVLLPFSFDQLFALNHYTGDDRLDNANQISMGLTSRLLNSDTGSTILTGSVGFAYYIENSRVCLSAGCATPDYRLSPIVGELAYTPTDYWSLSGSWAWDPNLRQTNNASINTSYTRDERRNISLGYFFVHGNGASIVTGILTMPTNIYSNNTSQITFSEVWPISNKWSTVGAWNYNITYHRTDSYNLGFQYDPCCWGMRVIMQRSYAGSTLTESGRIQNQYNTSFFVQLELKGLGDFGSSFSGQSVSAATSTVITTAQRYY